MGILYSGWWINHSWHAFTGSEDENNRKHLDQFYLFELQFKKTSDSTKSAEFPKSRWDLKPKDSPLEDLET